MPCPAHSSGARMRQWLIGCKGARRFKTYEIVCVSSVDAIEVVDWLFPARVLVVNGYYLTVDWLFLTVDWLFLTVDWLFLNANWLFLEPVAVKKTS